MSHKDKDSCFCNLKRGRKNTEGKDDEIDVTPVTGVYQSPINLPLTKDQEKVFLSEAVFSTGMQKVAEYKFDRTVKEWHVESKVEVANNETNYRLVEFHVHKFGEHIVNEKHFDMEIHFVFGDLRLTSIMVNGFGIVEGKESSEIIKAILAGDPFLLTTPCSYWAYQGSLTGSDNPSAVTVNWIFSACVLKASKEDICRLRELAKVTKPLQKRRGRNIVFAQENCE